MKNQHLFSSLAFALFYAICTSSAALANNSVAITTLLAHTSTYDGQHVSVTGTVTDVVAKTSHAGNPYETFNLCDSNSDCIHVFTFGQPSLSEGERKTVHGTFSAVKHVGSYTFYNEIEADDGSL